MSQSVTVEVPVALSVAIIYDPPVTAPPSLWTEAQVRARRLSLIMPTPTLDSRGRPT